MRNLREEAQSLQKSDREYYLLVKMDKTEKNKHIFPGLSVIEYGYAATIATIVCICFLPVSPDDARVSSNIIWIGMFYISTVFFLVGGIMIITKSRKIRNCEPRNHGILMIVVGIIGQICILPVFIFFVYVNLVNIIGR